MKAMAPIIWILLLLSACTPAPVPEIKVGTNVWLGYEPLYLARSRNLLQGSGIKLIEYSSANDVSRGLRDGTIDVAALTIDEVLTLLQDNIKLKIVLVMDVSHGADAVVAHADIGSVADLKGKKLGAETSAVGAYMTMRMLDVAELSIADISLSSLRFDEQEDAFLNHRVDAVVTFDPVRSRLLAAGGHVIFDSSRIPGEIVDVLVVRETVLVRQRAGLCRLLGNWFSALSYLHEHPQQAAEQMQGRLGLSADQILQNLHGLRFPDLQENYRLLQGETLAKTVANMRVVMRKRGLLHQAVSIENLLDTSCLPGLVDMDGQTL